VCRQALFMASHGKKIEKKIVEDVEKCFEEMYGHTELELVDVEYRRESSGWILRVYIDKEGGVLLDDCSMTSNQLGDIIEVKDIILGEYSLEVTSPGVNRPLKKEEDFIRVIGKTIKLKTRTLLNNRKNFKGVLKEFKDGMLKIDSDGKEFNILYKDVKKANLEYDFNKKQ
jgi:ribosome maturation factor RimP